MTDISGRAVVLGGSMAGVLAARALADHYDEVVVVDRDRFPAAGRHRSGVPQGRHIHALQTLGAQAIEQLFPGASEALVAEGAVDGDWGRDAAMCFSGHRLRPVDAGLDLLAASRPLLEGHLRECLAEVPGIRLLEGRTVQGLVLDPGGTAVEGIRTTGRGDDGAVRTLSADLVVDATGRASRLPRWLEAAGYEAPEVEESGLEIAYTSARFPRRPSDSAKVVLVTAIPPGRRGGGAIAVEGDSWIVTLAGVAGEAAPTDRDGFVEYAATLAVPDLHELVHDREFLSEPTLMRFPTGRRHRYDTLERFPEGLLVAGDSLCSFTPVYGQGMSVAAAEAVTLRDCLAHGTNDLAARYFAAIAPMVDDAWSMAVTSDARYVDDGDEPSRPTRLIAAYREHVLVAASEDPVVSRTFREVMAMTAPTTALVRPGIAMRVARIALGRAVRRRLARTPTTDVASPRGSTARSYTRPHG